MGGECTCTTDFNGVGSRREEGSRLSVGTLSLFGEVTIHRGFKMRFLQHGKVSTIRIVSPALLLRDCESLLPRGIRREGRVLFLSLSSATRVGTFTGKLSIGAKLPVHGRCKCLRPRQGGGVGFLSVRR